MADSASSPTPSSATNLVVDSTAASTLHPSEGCASSSDYSKVRKLYVPTKFFTFQGPLPEKPAYSFYRCAIGHCSWGSKSLSVSNISLYNLKRHIQTRHTKDNLKEFLDACTEGPPEKDKVISCKSAKQTILTSFVERKQKPLTQASFDDLVLDCIVTDMNPISVVEKPGFQNLLKPLIGDLHLKGRSFYTELLSKRYIDRKQLLIVSLKEAKFVCTTADCWSGHHKSFLGMTVHWFGQDLIRRSACLGLRRVTGSHTYDVLARAIDTLHNEFSISGKVKCAITDNGSNFVKSFRVFGETQNERRVQEMNEETDPECDDEEDSESTFIDLTEIFSKRVNDAAVGCELNVLDDSDDDSIVLPRHMRCNCHLLNLVATTDTAKITNPIFKKMKRALDGKLQAIWNAQSRSTCSADFIRQKLGLMFIVPNKTRWNSYYDALVRVQHFITRKNDALKAVFSKEGVPVLRSQEEEFLKEMVKIFQVLTEALDIFQHEAFMSASCVLPTLTSVLDKYKEFARDVNITHCTVLVTTLITAIRSRFDHLFKEHHLRIVSLSDPHFKTMWIVDEYEKADDFSRLKEEVNRRKSSDSARFSDHEDGSNNSEDSGSPSRKKTKTLFDMFRKKKSTEFDEVDKYLSEDVAELGSDFSQLDRYPTIKEILIEYNAALPSSAACERLFSTAGLIFTPKRTRLSDDNFGKLTFLKINGKCNRNWGLQPGK